MKLQIEQNPEPYGLERALVITYGISHLAYGATLEAAIAQFESRFSVTLQNTP